MARRRAVLCVAFAAAAFTGCAVQLSRERARRAKCVSNLRQIYMAIQVYATDNDDAFPPSLAELFPRYVVDGRLYRCPTAQMATVIEESDLPTGAKDAVGVFTEANTDYVYVPGMTGTFPPDCVLVYGKPGNHGEGEGTNVMFLAGHIAWLQPDALEAALARTRKAIQKRAEQ